MKPLLSSLRQRLILRGASPLSGGRTTLRRVHPTASKGTSTPLFFFFKTRPSRVDGEGPPPLFYLAQPSRKEGGAPLPFFHSAQPSGKGRGLPSLFYSAQPSRKREGLPPFSIRHSRVEKGGASPPFSYLGQPSRKREGSLPPLLLGLAE